MVKLSIGSQDAYTELTVKGSLDLHLLKRGKIQLSRTNLTFNETSQEWKIIGNRHLKKSGFASKIPPLSRQFGLLSYQIIPIFLPIQSLKIAFTISKEGKNGFSNLTPQQQKNGHFFSTSVPKKQEQVLCDVRNSYIVVYVVTKA